MIPCADDSWRCSKIVFFLDLDSVWAQSRHPGGLKIRFLVEFARNFEAQLSRPSGISNSMVFDDSCKKLQKNDFSDETVGVLDVFGDLEGHTRGKKYPPGYFAQFPTLKTIKNR